MASCNTTISSSKRKVCIGDLKSIITIKRRTLSTPDLDGVDYDLNFENKQDVYAMLVTKSGTQIFDGTSLLGVATHYFYIRFMDDLSLSCWVEHQDKNYKILDIEDIDERNEWLILRCAKMGDSTINANFSGVP